MKYRNPIVSLVAALLVVAACSDDSPTRDSSVDSQVQDDRGGTPTDKGRDAPADVGADRAVDQAVLDASRDASVDATKDATGEAVVVDMRVDRTPPDSGTPVIWGYISATAKPLLDGKGDLHVLVYMPGLPPPATIKVGGVVIPNADFSKAGNKIKYGIMANAPGPHQLYAFLDDNKNVMPLFPMPDYGDMTAKAAKQITVKATGSLRVDMVLTNVIANLGDAGVGVMGGLKGSIRATVTPTGDGKGHLYVSLHSQVPPAGQVAAAVVSNGDLSSPFMTESYLVTGVKSGRYYIRVFLDDNANVNPFLPPAPDKGDLVQKTAAQVRVVGGVVNTHNVVLDALK